MELESLLPSDTVATAATWHSTPLPRGVCGGAVWCSQLRAVPNSR